MLRQKASPKPSALNSCRPHTGYSTGPWRHCQDLRSECDSQAEREAQPLATRLSNRCCQLKGSDSGHDAPSNGQYGERGQRHGLGHEGHGPREGG